MGRFGEYAAFCCLQPLLNPGYDDHEYYDALLSSAPIKKQKAKKSQGSNPTTHKARPDL